MDAERYATLLDPADRARFERASAALDDAAHMARLYRLVASLRPEDAPRAVAVAGASRLRSAARAALFPGSFNPLTHAHVALAGAARQHLRLDAFAWSFATRTIDKESVTRAAMPDRVAQLDTYARSEEAVILLNRGLYVEQARAVRTLLPKESRLAILVGYDKIVQILDPHYYANREAALEELFALATVVVAPRDGEGAEALDALLSRTENVRYRPHVSYLPVPNHFAAESSTEARALAASDPFSPALLALLPPESLALVAIGPYAPAPADVPDPYHLRQQWLRLLSGSDIWRGVSLPAVSTLVALAQSEPEVREWLGAPTEHPIPTAVAWARRVPHPRP